MRNQRLLYWLIAGLLIGAGLIIFDIYFIALPLILIGLAVLTVDILRFRGHEFWAFFIGLGGLPALILISDIVTAGPPCTSQTLTLPPGATSASCTYIPQSYYVLATIFVAITLVGVIGLLLRRDRIER